MLSSRARACAVSACCALLLLLGSAAPAPVAADTPANCSDWSAFLGDWTYSYSPVDPAGPSEQCAQFDPSGQGVQQVTITLHAPNVATSSQGDKGNWTLIYNQGVEIWLGGNIWFAFSKYDAAGTSYCDQTLPGWVHSQAGNTHWACFSAQQTKRAALPQTILQETESGVTSVEGRSAEPSEEEQRVVAERRARARDPARLNAPYKHDHAFLAKVNAAQDWFTVKAYPELEGRTVGEVERRRGSTNVANPLRTMHSHRPRPPRRLTNTPIPAAFDWRNVSGQNFMSPVRDQGGCGSCYAFGSAAMMEARIRVASNNAQQPVLSTQDVVSCSEYSQGCEGGFPYLTAGKYARDFGMIEEACYPYQGVDSACTPDPQPGCKSQRWHSAEYYYIGGYYGESTVELMQEEILANGPIAVSFEVYDDFDGYSGGVYSHQFTKDLRPSNEFSPFEITNHVVSIVGWGVTDDDKKIPYWIVKNSWSESWGENGYFRILRGSSEAGGECAIESITVSAIPVLH